MSHRKLEMAHKGERTFAAGVRMRAAIGYPDICAGRRAVEWKHGGTKVNKMVQDGCMRCGGWPEREARACLDKKENEEKALSG